jgi:hypothetical protein
MQSKHTPEHFRQFAKARRLRKLALVAGLSFYFCLSCAFIGGGAIGFYKVMLPILYPNPGVPELAEPLLPSANATPRTAERSFAAEHPPGGKAVFASAIEPDGKPGGGAAHEASKGKQSEVAAILSDTKRKRLARPRRHDPMMDYAAQPTFGLFQPWGSYQTPIGYRPSGNYQASGGYRPRKSDQGWSGYRIGH